SSGLSDRSSVASYSRNWASSRTSSRNFFGSVIVRRSSVSLCCTSGCCDTCTSGIDPPSDVGLPGAHYSRSWEAKNKEQRAKNKGSADFVLCSLFFVLV